MGDLAIILSRANETIVMDPDCAVYTDEHVDADGTFGSTHKTWNGKVLGNGEVWR